MLDKIFVRYFQWDVVVEITCYMTEVGGEEATDGSFRPRKTHASASDLGRRAD